ncbi:MAG: fumarylacetoacetate hydrolase family protein [Gemmatimonadales bacterium]
MAGSAGLRPAAIPPRRPVAGRNAVYAADLNRKATLVALGDALHRPPYQTPPGAAVLHLKPANTWSESGAPIRCPDGVPALRMGGGVGLVIGRRASRVPADRALEWVRGLAVVNDVAVPYQSHYRPAIKERCRDGFCPIGPEVALAPGVDPASLVVRIEINGAVERDERPDYVRGAAALLADLTAFLTLDAGDIVLLGEPAEPPLARPGDTVRVIVEGLGVLENPVVG